MQQLKNKKIKNAQQTEEHGISFKSQLEAKVYAILVENGFNPKYEEKKFVLSPRIRPTVPFYNRVQKIFTQDIRPIQAITYTPDFTFMFNGILIIIEVKGFENDTFPIKKNLFRKYLEEQEYECLYFEIRTKGELLDAIKFIRSYSPLSRSISQVIALFPDKKIPRASKFLKNEDWRRLLKMTTSVITKVEQGKFKCDEATLGRFKNLETVLAIKMRDDVS